MKTALLLLGVALLAGSFQLTARGGEPPAPVITNFNAKGSQKNLRFAPYPAASNYTILSATNLVFPFTPNTNFSIAPYLIRVYTNGTNVGTNFGYEWRVSNSAAPSGFYRVRVIPMSSNALLAATVLNRLTYGPTPDELNIITNIGPDAYIAQQLAPWTITEDVTNTHANFAIIQSQFAEATNFVYMTNADISDLRAWHILRAVGARRQLLEILLQFFENHFVTQWSKSQNYLGTYYDDNSWQNVIAAQFEYLENEKWRAALLNPSCTFYDLLKISAESPAMIIFLDTVTSKSNNSNVANENYAREIMELFCMGVDNGYDQTDITTQSRIWTGWTVEKVALSNAFNPFAPAMVAGDPLYPGSTTNQVKSNFFGAWAFNFKAGSHDTSSGNNTVFTNKFVPSRFGPPWTTNKYAGNTTPGAYQIAIAKHSKNDTNGLAEGYQFMTNIANYPFTEEYISIKLCRLLVHDDFPNPSNDPGDDAYSTYNYAAGNLSPESDLVHRCMLAWETNSPKGQIWKVLKTITDSDLFRSHGGSQQKIKTPLEFAVSAIRALRSSTNGSNLAGSFTAYTDGYNIGGVNSGSATVLSRAGGMLLFDRDAPDGYPEAGVPWISAGTVSERLRFVQSLCIAQGQDGHKGSSTNDAGNNTISDIVSLLKAKTPASSWTNDGAVADYFLALLYPGEGAGNLALYRSAAVNYLNTDENGNAAPFRTNQVSNVANSTYDNRVRGVVGMLMTMQRFQEQ